ncbi:MAG: antitoxin [Bacteroidales bacterium]|nr:antitoxin [Bacteroidales bacterium]
MGLWKSAINLAKGAGKVVTYPVKHPMQTLGAGKKAVVGGAAGYVGWEAIVNDKPMAETVTGLVVGEEAAQKVGETVDATLGIISTTAQTVNDVSEKASSALTGIGNVLGGGTDENGQSKGGLFSGIGNFMTSLLSGNGGSMIGDFFSNIGKGKVSGLSLAGLVGAGLLIFGRFGWLGKIAGALLAMTILGGNVNTAKVMGGEQLASNNNQSRQPALNPAESQTQVSNTPVIHRGR